jgi:hypothetical protein
MLSSLICRFTVRTMDSCFRRNDRKKLHITLTIEKNISIFKIYLIKKKKEKIHAKLGTENRRFLV